MARAKPKHPRSPAQERMLEAGQLIFALSGMRSRLENLSTSHLPPGLLCGLDEALDPIDNALGNVRRWISENRAGVPIIPR